MGWCWAWFLWTEDRDRRQASRLAEHTVPLGALCPTLLPVRACREGATQHDHLEMAGWGPTDPMSASPAHGGRCVETWKERGSAGWDRRGQEGPKGKAVLS